MSNRKQFVKRDTHSEIQQTLLRDIREKSTLSEGHHSENKVLLSNIDSKIGVDSSSSPLSLTALVRNQKDTIDQKLGTLIHFLDKDSSGFIHKHHTTSNLIGNSAVDGTGSHRHIVVDSNGAIQTTTSGGGSSVIKGNDGVDGAGTDRTIQTTSQGRLIVDVVELAASGQITTSTALASIQACGYDTSTSKFKTLKVSTDGELHSIKKAKYESSYPVSGGDDTFGHTNCPDATSTTLSTITIDTDRQLIGINYIISLELLLSGNGGITFKGSIDGTTYRTIETKTITSTADFDQASGGLSHFLMNNDVMVADGHLYKYYQVEVLNTSGSTRTAKVGHTILYA